MMKKQILLFSLLFLLAACQRRGGRPHMDNNTSRISHPHTSEHVVNEEHSTSEKQTIITDDVSLESVLSEQSKRKYTGTEIFDKYSSAVFMVYTSNGVEHIQGSAFFISSSGIAVSNYHVFESTLKGMERFSLSDGRLLKLKRVIAKDKKHDIFIFQVDAYGNNFNYIPISKRIPKVGERVFTIGSPQGLENTFSSGEISQLRSEGLIQISAPIDHGSSGGVLLNEYGEAIGITTSGYDDSGANLNFAVDIKYVNQLLQ